MATAGMSYTGMGQQPQLQPGVGGVAWGGAPGSFQQGMLTAGAAVAATGGYLANSVNGLPLNMTMGASTRFTLSTG